MATPITGIETPVYGPSVWTGLASMAAALEALGVPRFASTTARDAALPSPATGQCCFVTGVGVQVRNTSWVTLATAPSVAALQAALDALTARVEALENALEDE
jgi:hypothetical protein